MRVSAGSSIKLRGLAALRCLHPVTAPIVTHRAARCASTWDPQKEADPGGTSP